jgi:hypothetical protein
MLARTAAATTAAAGIACILHVIGSVGCDDPISHPYLGRLYVGGRDCLGAIGTVDVVEGADPGDCAPACLTKSSADGGFAVYVSAMCAPYPPFYDAGGSDPACPSALAALARGDQCLDDGGSTHPPPSPPSDAGTD